VRKRERKTERPPKKSSVSVASSESPASVLDASALLAHLNEEKGASDARQAMADGAAISVVNWIEVLSKIAERGEDPELATAELKGAGLIGGVVTIEPVTEEDSVEIARLRPLTKKQGLSLADRACLALATRLGVSAVTADRAWEHLPEVDVAVKLIR
jgi:PIN domain nuclease of toxin-antitoxin system